MALKFSARRRRSRISSPTAPALSCCIPCRALPASRSRSCMWTAAARSRASPRSSIRCSPSTTSTPSATRLRRATGRSAAWRATASRWRTIATGPMPPSRPMCGRWRSPGPTRCRPAKPSTRRSASPSPASCRSREGRRRQQEDRRHPRRRRRHHAAHRRRRSAEEADNAISAADALKAAGLQQLICQIDCRRGDGHRALPALQAARRRHRRRRGAGDHPRRHGIAGG